MSRFQTIIRTLSLIGLSPDQVLGECDRHFAELARLPGDDHVASCLIVIYDPATQQCQAANAGHILPILIHPDGHHEIIDIPTGALLGAAGPGFPTCTFPAGQDSILAMCTDGFAVLHHADIDQALTRLRASLTDPKRPLDEMCDSAFHGIDTDIGKDDATLLLARLLGSQT
jgi:serine phosphatase RsbU (regulator of sigma subunit)